MARQRSGAPSPAPQGAAPKVKKTRWYHQVWQAYQMTRATDPSVTWWVLGAFAAVLAVAIVIALFLDTTGYRVYAIVIGLPFAVLAGMFVLARRAEKAAYRRLEGQPGASISALRTIRRGWDFPEEPVAADRRSQDLVFRGLGRAGIVLVGEGPGGRQARLLDAEKRKIARILPNVPVTVIQSGNGPDQVPLPKLARTVQKLKPTLTKQEVAEIGKRLRALGGARLPVPKGIDPYRARPDRKGMRGR